MKESSESSDSIEETYGTLLFFRKDGQTGTSYPLLEGQTTFGSSLDADVRLKLKDELLEEFHCTIDVNSNGIAILTNHSIKAPVRVNKIPVRKLKVLRNEDVIELLQKKFQYLNDNVSNKNVRKYEVAALKAALSSSKARRSMAPLVQRGSAKKKSPNLGTKKPVKISSLKRKSTESSGVEFTNYVTPLKKPDKKPISEKSKTTSKVVVSKALGSTKRHRLSLGNSQKQLQGSVTKISARNILFDRNMICEEDEKLLPRKRGKDTVENNCTPQKCLVLLSVMDQRNDPAANTPAAAAAAVSLRKSALKKSLNMTDKLNEFESPRKSILKNTPRKSMLKQNENQDLLSKIVSFSDDKSTELHTTGKSLGYRPSEFSVSDESPRWRLSSSSSVSPIRKYFGKDSDFSSDVESPLNDRSVSALQKTGEIAKSRLSLRKSMADVVPKRQSGRKSRLSLGKSKKSEPKETSYIKSDKKSRLSMKEKDIAKDESSRQCVPKLVKEEEEKLSECDNREKYFDEKNCTPEKCLVLLNAMRERNTRSVDIPVNKKRLITPSWRKRSLDATSNINLGARKSFLKNTPRKSILKKNENNDVRIEVDLHTSRKSSGYRKSDHLVSDELQCSRLSSSVSPKEDSEFSDPESPLPDPRVLVLQKDIEKCSTGSSRRSTADTVPVRESLGKLRLAARKSKEMSDIESNEKSISVDHESSGQPVKIVRTPIKKCETPEISIQKSRLSLTKTGENPAEGILDNLSSRKSRLSLRNNINKENEQISSNSDSELVEDHHEKSRLSLRNTKNRKSLRKDKEKENEALLGVSDTESSQDTDTTEDNLPNFGLPIRRTLENARSRLSLKKTRSSENEQMLEISDTEPTEDIFEKSRLSSRRSKNNENKLCEMSDKEVTKQTQKDGLSMTKTKERKSKEVSDPAATEDIIQKSKLSMRNSIESTETYCESLQMRHSLRKRNSTKQEEMSAHQAGNESYSSEELILRLSESPSKTRNNEKQSQIESSSEAEDQTPIVTSLKFSTPKERKSQGTRRSSNRKSTNSRILNDTRETLSTSTSRMKSENSRDDDLEECPEMKRTAGRVSLRTSKADSFKNEYVGTESSEADIDNDNNKTGRSEFSINSTLSESVKVDANDKSYSKKRRSIRQRNISKEGSSSDEDQLFSKELQIPLEQMPELKNMKIDEDYEESLRECSNTQSLEGECKNSTLSERVSNEDVESYADQSSSEEESPKELQISCTSETKRSTRYNKFVNEEAATSLKNTSLPLMVPVLEPNQRRKSSEYFMNSASFHDNSAMSGTKLTLEEGKKSSIRKSTKSPVKRSTESSVSHVDSTTSSMPSTPDEKYTSSIEGRKFLSENQAFTISSASTIMSSTPGENQTKRNSKNCSVELPIPGKTIRFSGRRSRGNECLVDNDASNADSDEMTQTSYIKRRDAQKYEPAIQEQTYNSSTAPRGTQTPEQRRISSGRNSRRNKSSSEEYSCNEVSPLPMTCKTPALIENQIKINKSTVADQTYNYDERVSSSGRRISRRNENCCNNNSALSVTTKTPDRNQIKLEKYDDQSCKTSSLLLEMETPESKVRSSSRRISNRNKSSVESVSCNEDTTLPLKSETSDLEHRNSSDDDSFLSLETKPPVPIGRSSGRMSNINNATDIKNISSDAPTFVIIRNTSEQRMSLCRSTRVSTESFSKTRNSEISSKASNKKLLKEESNSFIEVLSTSLEEKNTSVEINNSRNDAITARRSRRLSTKSILINLVSDNEDSAKDYSLDSDSVFSSSTPEIHRSLENSSSSRKNGNTQFSEYIDDTPENSSSVVCIDTPPDQSRRVSRRLRSLQEDDLTTPKSAVKRQSSRYLPYNPPTEDISPATPLPEQKNDSSFKTPLNTPGLFENIRKSVLRSRSRMQRSSSSLMEELNMAKPVEKALKRPRESTGDSARSTKRRKLVINTDDTFEESFEESFDSFHTEEVLKDLSDQTVTHVTPKHFSNLTDKPIITSLSTKKCSTEPKSNKSIAVRQIYSDCGSTIVLSDFKLEEDCEQSAGTNSLQETKKEQISEHDFPDDTRLEKLSRTSTNQNRFENISVDIKTSLESSAMICDSSDSKHSFVDEDSTAISSPKKQQKKPRKSCKNDLSDVAGIKRLLSTPKVTRSPKNDLTNVAGVKQLLRTPKFAKSPKNDLTNIYGVKKLLATPKTVTTPKNDLTKVPNLRKFLSPKYQKSPRNDLTDVRGLKRLMRTPRPNKEPHNDLTNVDGVSDIFNMQRMSNPSKNENNEDLFAKLFDKKPIKTYRGKSLSPLKIKDAYGATRKTLGDLPANSPRVENWIKHQAAIKQRINDTNEVNLAETLEGTDKEFEGEENPIKVLLKPSKRTTRATNKGRVEETKAELPKKAAKGRKKVVKEEQVSTEQKIEETPVSSPMVERVTRGRRKGKKTQEPLVSDFIVERVIKDEPIVGKEMEEISGSPFVERVIRGRRKADKKIEEILVSSPLVQRAIRGRRKEDETVEEIPVTFPIEEKVTRGRRRKVAEKMEDTPVSSPIVEIINRGQSKVEKKMEEISISSPIVVKGTRGRRRKMDEMVEEIPVSSPVVERVTVGKRKVDEKMEETPLSSPVVEKITRGRRRRADEKMEEVPVPSAILEKVTRGRRNKVDEKVEEVPIPTVIVKKGTRGRRKATEKNEQILDTSVVETTTRNESLEKTAMSEGVDESAESSKKLYRGRRKAKQDNLTVPVLESSKNKKEDREGFEIKPVDSIENKMEPKKSRTRGRNLKSANQISPEEVSNDDIPNSTRSIMPHPKIGDSEENVVNIEVKPAKTIKGRKRKQNEEIVMQNSGEPAEKSTRGKEKAEQLKTEPEEPFKATRRRQKPNDEVENQEPIEPVRATRGRPAKSKVLEESPLDSPRMRAMQGNLNKPGSSSSTEGIEKKDGRKRKKVHFE